MKIVFIFANYSPRTQVDHYRICKKCEEFSKVGVDVELWLYKNSDLIKSGIFNFFNLKKRYPVKEIFNINFLKYKKKIGHIVVYLQSISLLTVLLINKILGKISKDSIIYSGNLEVVWFFKLLGHKTCFETHGKTSDVLWLHKYLIKNVDFLFVITEWLKQEYIKYGVNESKILLTPSGVDLSCYNINLSKDEIKKEYSIPSHKIVLGYTGMFCNTYGEKGVLTAIDSMQYLNDDFLLLIVGGKKYEIKKYLDICKKLKVDHRVIFTGYVLRKNIPLYHKASDILIAPYSDGEHFKYYMAPLKLFEYMASKRPIITSDLPAIREIFNKSNSVLVKPSDPRDLADGIKKLSNNRELAKSISIQAFQDVQKLTWEKRVKEIINFLNN